MQHLLWTGEEMAKTAKTTPAMLKLSEKDDDILYAFARFHYLTAEHVTRLFFSAGSVKHVKAKLKTLADAEYLQRLYFIEKKPGKARHVYHLASDGIAHLKDIGKLGKLRYRPSEEERRSDYFLAHTLACNDVFISAELVNRTVPNLRLRRWVHERDLRRTPVRLVDGTDTTGKGKPVIPDGWLDFRIRERDGSLSQACVLLELDRDSEEEKRWRGKVRDLMAMTTKPSRTEPSPYEQVYGTDIATIAVVVAPRDPARAERRCAELLTWTVKELTALGLAHRADDFRFIARPEAADDARFWTGRCWSRPLSTELVPVLEL